VNRQGADNHPAYQYPRQQRPYTHPVYGTQQVQQYPFPQTAPGTIGQHLPPKKRPGWRIAVGVALALVALLVLVAAITGGSRGGAAIVRPTQNTGPTRADAQGRAGEMRPDRPTRRHCLADPDTPGFITPHSRNVHRTTDCVKYVHTVNIAHKPGPHRAHSRVDDDGHSAGQRQGHLLALLDGLNRRPPRRLRRSACRAGRPGAAGAGHAVPPCTRPVAAPPGSGLAQRPHVHT
jgi:hypothetical protein